MRILNLAEGEKKYGTIYADPPWPYRSPGSFGNGTGVGTKRFRVASSEQRYGVMSIDDLKAMPVSDIVEDNAHLYLWVTNSFLVEGHDVARAWGFEPKTMLTWVKVQNKPIPKPVVGFGTYYRNCTEHILFCTRGSMKLAGPVRTTAYLLPRTPHSVKPVYFYYLIEEQSPGPYLELFSRTPRQGWDFWGTVKVKDGISCK